MTIDRLNDKTILVTLMGDDMERYCLDFTAGADAVRRGLTRLMGRVGEECGLDCGGRSCLVEALPAGGSCLLIITVRPPGRRRTYRVKRVTRQECWFFDSIDALLDWSRAGARVSGSLYTYAGGFWLLPDYPPVPSVRRGLTEYASLSELGAVERARIRELGEPVGACPSRRRVCPRTARQA